MVAQFGSVGFETPEVGGYVLARDAWVVATSNKTSGVMWVNIFTNKTQLHAILCDPVPHLQWQMQCLGILVQEVLQHGEVHGGVKI